MHHPRPMRLEEIHAALRQAVPLLVDGVVTRVREPMPDHLAIEVRKAGRNHELVIGVTAGMSRIHLATDLPPTPPGPGNFTLRARKRMRPARVTALTCANDRLVRLSVSQHQAEEGSWCTTLVAELFGRGRLFLLDDEARILAVTGPGGDRGLNIGELYQPPSQPEPSEALPAAVSIDSATLEARYSVWLSQADHEAQQRQAQRQHSRQRQRLERRIAAMQGDLKRLAQWPNIQREAELLAGHRHLLERGMASVEVSDWFDAACPQRTITLDPTQSPEENLQQRFRQAKRAKYGIPTLEAKIARDQAALAQWDPIPPAAPATPPAPGKDKNTLRHFSSVDGWRIYVGRSARDNDHITFRLARGNELWFHARDTPGSHVLLRGNKGEPPQRAIHDAALLAAHFSKLKQQGGGEVMYTQRKYLKRPKRGKPGQVLVTQERVIGVTLPDPRLDSLLATRA